MSDRIKPPDWWPENPYFASAMVTITDDLEYAIAIPDEQLRTAVSWYLGNRYFELVSQMVLRALEAQGLLEKIDD